MEHEFQPNERRQVVGFPNYTVDVLGNVYKKFSSSVTLKKIPTHNNYRAVNLVNTERRKRKKISQIVLEAFVGPCPADHEVCHEDDDRSNDALSNLHWGTKSENCKQREDRKRSRSSA